jgi:hypothetical protein
MSNKTLLHFPPYCSNTGKCICGDNWIDTNENAQDGCEKFSNGYLKNEKQCEG